MEHMELSGPGRDRFSGLPLNMSDQLIAEKQFTNLKGLIYFTDGYGMFPVKMPAYETAFVFMREDYSDADVPPWAIKVILGPEEIEASEEI